MTTWNAPQFFGQVSTFLRGLTLRHKMVLALSAVIVVGTVWLFVRLIGKADYKPLYSELSSSEAQSISRRLAAKNIRYELSSDGATLRVPAGQLDEIRLEMAAQGLPHTGRLGFELFDKPNWGGSDFAEKVNYQRALEGELERTIQTIREVEAVRVHLVLSRESLFTEREREAKAAVVVKLRGGGLADDATYAITQLVSSGVDNLRAENVTVVNADGQIPLLAHSRGGAGAPQGTGELETKLAKKLVATLSPVVGPDKVKATVTVEYDLSSSESTHEIYDPDASVVLSSQVLEERMGSPAVAGIPGTAANVPGAELLVAPDADQLEAPDAELLEAPDADQLADTGEVLDWETGESQVQRSESKTFAVSKTVRHTVLPPGGIKRINASVLVDDAVEVKEGDNGKVEERRKRTPEEMEQIRELAMVAIGFNAERGDRLAVENLSFLSLPLESPTPPTGIERLLLILERWTAVLRYLALAALFGLVYLLLLRPIKKQVLTTFRQLPGRLGGAGKATPALAPAAAEQRMLPEEDTLEMEASLQRELTQTSSEVKRAVMLKRHLVEKVKREPVGASRLIQNWMRQTEGR